jgi:two-component system, cell cycle sensor histidine kinase and response regulator CckA
MSANFKPSNSAIPPELWLDPSANPLAATADLVSEALLILTPEGSVAFANRHFTEWFGLSQEQTQAGTPLETLREKLSLCFSDPKTFQDKWRCPALPQESGPMETWEITRPARRILEFRTSPLPGQAGTLILWRDLTEKRELQDALHRAQRMESLGRLSGGIAHDINNLLTAISGNLSLALHNLDSGNSAESRSLLATASKAAIGGREIVKQLLTHARKNTETVQSFDLPDLIADARGLLKHTISPLVLVEFQLPKSLWPVTADRNSIQQVIINLCVNAVDAMKGRANSRLSLTAANVPRTISRPAGRGRPGTDYVCLSVRDNGCGMPAEVLQRIFEPFYTTKAQGEGTGLGLSISREIVEKFGGWIECDSQPGSGTTFRVYLPRGEKIPVEKKPAPAAFAKTSRSAPSAERILVVDDDALVRAVSARLLSSVGYKVFTAVDGIEALEWLRTPGNVADLVLLDVSMPRLSGHDTMQQIRLLRPGLPVVMCSGSLSLCDPEAPQEGDPLAPPEGRIAKPYDIGELTRTVRTVLDHPNIHASVCAA